MGTIVPYIMESKKNVWNHQPARMESICSAPASVEPDRDPPGSNKDQATVHDTPPLICML